MAKGTIGIKEIVTELKQYEGCESLTKTDIKAVVNSLLEEIANRLENNEEINFIGFFNFGTRKQAAKEMIMRFGKDRGKKKKIAAKKVPTFKFSPAFKKRIVESK